MSRLNAAAATEPHPASVTFVPLTRTHVAGTPRLLDLSHLPLINQVVQQLRRPLADLGARARRAGPVSGGTILLLTGCCREVGCTTVAAALAASTLPERPVLLIDGDLAHPGLTGLGGKPIAFGWDDLLQARCSPEQIIQHLDSRQALPFVGLRQPMSRPEILFALPSFASWLARLREEYSLVVVDGGSVTDGGAAWARHADVALIVCDSGRTLADEWARAWDSLEEAGIHVLGLVETFT